MERTREENIALCERYPFLLPWNRWSGKKITEAEDGGYWPGDPDAVPEYDYEYTELDSLPDGWDIAFGRQMCEELREALIEDDDLDKWRIVQMKEKFGGLRLYDNGCKQGSRVPDIIEKYERISERTCINCGKPATKITCGWIMPVCDDCAPEKGCADINEYYSAGEDFI